MIGIIRETARTLQQVDVLVNCTSVGEEFLYQVSTVSNSKLKKTDTENYIEKLSRYPEDLGISIPIMCKVFPFHIVLDRDMKIVQLGRGLLKIFKTKIKEDRNFSTFFEIKTPKVSVTFDDIAQLSNVPFVLIIRMVDRSSETLQVCYLIEISYYNCKYYSKYLI